MSLSIHFHGKYQELPDVQPKKVATAESVHKHQLAERVSTGGVCTVYDDPEGSTAVLHLPDVKPDVVFYFISDLENFVNLSHQIRCATPKSRGNRVRRKSSAVQYLDVTFVRRSYYFWQILETADSTFQAQDPKVARVITFTSKNTQGEKTTSIYTIEEHQGGGTQIINKVAVTDGVASARGGCLGCCWDERFSNIKSDQKQFLNGLGGAIHSTASPLMLFDDEYIV